MKKWKYYFFFFLGGSKTVDPHFAQQSWNVDVGFLGNWHSIQASYTQVE